MLKNRFFRMIAMTLVICMLLPIIVCTAETGDQAISATEEEIQLLLDMRASVLSKIFLEEINEGSTQTYNENVSELNEIDLSLSRLGATFLTKEEVNAQFPETKCDKALSLSGQTQAVVENNSVQPMAEAPYGSPNLWISYRSTYTSNGTTYNIQRLVAQPQDSASPLAKSAITTVYLSQDWEASALSFLSFLATTYINGVTSQIPGANIALSLYDCLYSIVSGLNDDMEVNADHISYAWSMVTTASFAYVRLENQSDDYQWLSLISTKVEADVGYQMPSFYYVDYDGCQVLAPDIVQGQRSISAVPTDYDSTLLAISAYNSGVSGLQRCVTKLKISGAEGQRVVELNPVCPAYLIHCEI